MPIIFSLMVVTMVMGIGGSCLEIFCSAFKNIFL